MSPCTPALSFFGTDILETADRKNKALSGIAEFHQLLPLFESQPFQTGTPARIRPVMLPVSGHADFPSGQIPVRKLTEEQLCDSPFSMLGRNPQKIDRSRLSGEPQRSQNHIPVFQNQGLPFSDAFSQPPQIIPLIQTGIAVHTLTRQLQPGRNVRFLRSRMR